jgi:hypothetical protein
MRVARLMWNSRLSQGSNLSSNVECSRLNGEMGANLAFTGLVGAARLAYQTDGKQPRPPSSRLLPLQGLSPLQNQESQIRDRRNRFDTQSPACAFGMDADWDRFAKRREQRGFGPAGHT